MSQQDLAGMREQIIANAKLMLRIPRPAISNRDSVMSSSATNMIFETIDVVVFGEGSKYVAAVMLGLKPAIEGGEGITPEAAVRKLLLAVAETLYLYIPKVGAHQRNIHGGGVFDEDLITKDIKEAQRMAG